MLRSENPNNSALMTDPFGTLSIKGFITRFNKQLQKLIAKLEREQEHLVKGSADQISDAAQDKLACMQELSSLITEYFNSSDDKSSSTNGLENSLQLINEICIKHKIEEWNQTHDLIKYCHDLSDENSVLLANRLKSTNSALDTLFSLTGSTQNKTYDHKGLSEVSRTSRQLASV